MSFKAEIVEIAGELGIILPPEFVAAHKITPETEAVVEKDATGFLLKFIGQPGPES